MRGKILIFVLLLFLIVPIATAEDMTIDGGNVWIKTNYSSTCVWYAEKPMRECYHDFYIIPKNSKDLKSKIISPKLKFDTKKNTQLMSMSLNFDSKLKTSITNKEELYRIEFLAPPNYAEKYNFTINIDGKDILIDPDVSACGTLASGGIYNITADITCNAVYCFTITSSDVWIEGNNFQVTRGTDMNFLVRVASPGLGNLTVKNLIVNSLDAALTSTYSLNHLLFYYENLYVVMSKLYNTFGNEPNNITVINSYFEGRIDSNPSFRYVGENWLLENNTFNITASTGGVGFIRPDQAGDKNLMFLNNTIIYPLVNSDPFLWLQHDTYNLNFINNTILNWVEDNGYDLFYFDTAYNTHEQIRFTGNIFNTTTSFNDMFRVDAGTFDNNTAFFDNNWYGNTSASEFSDVCDDLNYDGVCDDWYQLTGVSGVYDENPMTFPVTFIPTSETVLVNIIEPIIDFIKDVNSFKIKYKINTTCNVSNVTINGTLKHTVNVNHTTSYFIYPTELSNNENADYNISVCGYSNLDNSVFMCDSVYINFEYSLRSHALRVYALVSAVIIIICSFAMLNSAVKKDFHGLLISIVSALCVLILTALILAFI